LVFVSVLRRLIEALATDPPLGSDTVPLSSAVEAPPWANATLAHPTNSRIPRMNDRTKHTFIRHPLEKPLAHLSFTGVHGVRMASSELLHV
jgi:hypothetical protein